MDGKRGVGPTRSRKPVAVLQPCGPAGPVAFLRSRVVLAACCLSAAAEPLGLSTGPLALRGGPLQRRLPALPGAAVTCHQDEQNRGMVGAEFLAHCKRGVRIINVARGEAACPVGQGVHSGRKATWCRLAPSLKSVTISLG